MTTAAELGRRAEAHARQTAIDACSDCDEHGWITGRHRSPDGVTRDAAWRCDHTSRPMPDRFIPDPHIRPKRQPSRKQG